MGGRESHADLCRFRIGRAEGEREMGRREEGEREMKWLIRVGRLEEERISGMRVEQSCSSWGRVEGEGGVMRVRISSVMEGGAVRRFIFMVGIESERAEGEAVMRRLGMNFFFLFLWFSFPLSGAVLVPPFFSSVNSFLVSNVLLSD